MAGISDRDAGRVGWQSGLRLSLIYALFFTAVSASLFMVAYHAVARTIHERELDIVRNRAAEYRAWFIRGDVGMLEARMDEQSMQTGDVMFVRVTGEELDFVKFNAPGGSIPSVEDIRNLGAEVEGSDVEIGDERWAVASLPLGVRRLVLQAGKNAAAADAMLARLRGIFTLTFIPAILAAVLGGALLTYRGMAPIRRLIVAMREILRGDGTGRRIEPVRVRNELNGLVELFNRLLARNEKLIGAMHQSLDSVAHDFRTPLSRLNITAQRALEKGGGDAEELRDALADCVEESEQLGRLLTTLMDVAEAESGAMRLDLDEVLLPELIGDVVELYEFVAEEKGVTVEVDVPEKCSVRADRVRLTQALANVVDNAIKYSFQNGTVSVAARRESADDPLVISVSDNGSGISEVDLPHIWDRLYRAEPSRSTPGMGLGLSFVKAIIEAHGGSVSVTSERGKGTEFRMELMGGD